MYYIDLICTVCMLENQNNTEVNVFYSLIPQKIKMV